MGVETSKKWQRWNRAAAQRKLAALRDSGLGLQAYGEREGFNAQRLIYWSKKLEGRGIRAASVGKGQAPCKPTFLPVVVHEQVRGAAQSLRSEPGEDRAQVSPEWAARFVRALLQEGR